MVWTTEQSIILLWKGSKGHRLPAPRVVNTNTKFLAWQPNSFNGSSQWNDNVEYRLQLVGLKINALFLISGLQRVFRDRLQQT